MEAVLSGVSAGVIGLDQQRPHHAAQPLGRRRCSGLGDAELVGKPLGGCRARVRRPARPASRTGHEEPRASTKSQFSVGDEERTFAVSVTRESGRRGRRRLGRSPSTTSPSSFSAQRTSAWADVARRIAHEIKNPLTPIQLSAERLRRKYGKHDHRGPRDCSRRCTDDHRAAGRRHQDAWSTSSPPSRACRKPRDGGPGPARLPCRAGRACSAMATRDVDFELAIRRQSRSRARFDRRLDHRRPSRNLVKNAAEAIQSLRARRARRPPAGKRPHRDASCAATATGSTSRSSTTAPGLPKQNRTRLLEPYVTTKGTRAPALASPSCRRVVEQHGGTLSLEDAPPSPDATHGALVRMTLPVETELAGRSLAPTKSTAAAHAAG